jgi:hypothetical protein
MVHFSNQFIDQLKELADLANQINYRNYWYHLLVNLPGIFEDASINQQQAVILINLELWGSDDPALHFDFRRDNPDRQ